MIESEEVQSKRAAFGYESEILVLGASFKGSPQSHLSDVYAAHVFFAVRAS